MWYLHSTEKWLEEVVKLINEKQFDPEDSRFMIAFFSSLDDEFVDYFQKSKEQISSYSGRNFHIFTPLIYENKVIPDDEWRIIKREFISKGIPINNDPTFIFFKLVLKKDGNYEPSFFAGFICASFINFPTKLKNAIDASIKIDDFNLLQQNLTKIFLSKNIILTDKANRSLKQAFSDNLPKSKIFISHSSLDKPFATKLMNELSQETDLKFWIDENEILTGDDIQKSITKSLKQSDYLFLIISENSIKSNWVNFELSQFMGFSDGKNIIPIVISKVQKFPEPIDNLIRRLKYLDFSDPKKWNKNINEIKMALSKESDNPVSSKVKTINFNDKVENAVVGDNNKITIKNTKKKIIQKYPEGCIGFDTIKANYIGHLINRYNEYKEYEVGKGQVKYAVFAGHLKKKYKLAPTRTLYNLQIEKFDELVNYIQSRIDSTKLSKVKGKGHKNYSTYEEFING